MSLGLTEVWSKFREMKRDSRRDEKKTWHPGSPGEEGASRTGGDRASSSLLEHEGQGRATGFMSCSYCCCSVAQSCLTLCDPIACSMPGSSVFYYLLEFAHTHICWVVQLLGTVIKTVSRLWSGAMLSRSVVSDSLKPHGLLCPWNSPGKNTGVGCHALLQGSSRLRDWTHISYVSCTGRGVLYHWCRVGSPGCRPKVKSKCFALESLFPWSFLHSVIYTYCVTPSIQLPEAGIV